MAYKKKFTEAEREAYKQEKKARTNALLTEIDNMTEALFTEQSELQAFLKFAGSFYDYSYNNQLLLRRAGATKVHTYQAWKKLGRHVKSGEKSIELLSPSSVKTEREKYVLDANGQKVKNPDGTYKTEKIDDSFIRFNIISVFDVSQTAGENIPELLVSEEETFFETDDELFDALNAVLPTLKRDTPEQMLRSVVKQELQAGSAREKEDAIMYMVSSHFGIPCTIPDIDLSNFALNSTGKEKKAFMKDVTRLATSIIKELH